VLKSSFPVLELAILPFQLYFIRKIVYGVLLVLFVLPSSRVYHHARIINRLISLRELLKGEAPVAKDLGRYAPGSLNLEYRVGHLKRRPMLVILKIFQEFRHCLCVVLVVWVRNPSAVSYNLLMI
jgi:hypothetical protein